MVYMLLLAWGSLPHGIHTFSAQTFVSQPHPQGRGGEEFGDAGPRAVKEMDRGMGLWCLRAPLVQRLVSLGWMLI